MKVIFNICSSFICLVSHMLLPYLLQHFLAHGGYRISIRLTSFSSRMGLMTFDNSAQHYLPVANLFIFSILTCLHSVFAFSCISAIIPLILLSIIGRPFLTTAAAPGAFSSASSIISAARSQYSLYAFRSHFTSFKSRAFCASFSAFPRFSTASRSFSLLFELQQHLLPLQDTVSLSLSFFFLEGYGMNER